MIFAPEFAVLSNREFQKNALTLVVISPAIGQLFENKQITKTFCGTNS